MEFLNRHKRLFLASGIVICFIAIIVTITGVAPTSFLGRVFGHVVTPLQRGASSVTGWIAGRWAVLANSDQILAENAALREENIRLVNENMRLPHLEEENERLNLLLEMEQRYPHLPVVGARMIGQNPNDWESSFIIDKGSNHGIYPHMIVLGFGGVLGRIEEVGANHARVISIRDTNFAAAARNARTEDVGTVHGDLMLGQDGLMRMEYIVATAAFMAEDRIYTSDHGAFFPPGLLIGTVVSVHPSPGGGGLTQYAIIQPAVDLNRVDFVLIVNQLFGDAPDPGILVPDR